MVVTRQSFTINEFCEAHRVSRSQFYILLKAGAGPKLMKVGSMTRISVEAAAEWRRNLESQSTAHPAHAGGASQ